MNNSISKRHTLIILDWDDTLFPTNWVLRNDINLMTSQSRNQYIVHFQELDKVLAKLLYKLSSYGKVVIITNALPEWIKMSSVVLPNTSNIIKKLRVVSARAMYQQFSSNMMSWKEMAFKSELINEFKHHNFLNIISIGDAEYEYRALISLNKWKPSTQKVLKSIRFMKDPSHDILIDQLEVLINAIPEIVVKQSHLDLQLNQYSHVHKKHHK